MLVRQLLLDARGVRRAEHRHRVVRSERVAAVQVERDKVVGEPRDGERREHLVHEDAVQVHERDEDVHLVLHQQRVDAADVHALVARKVAAEHAHVLGQARHFDPNLRVVVSKREPHHDMLLRKLPGEDCQLARVRPEAPRLRERTQADAERPGRQADRTHDVIRWLVTPAC